MSLLVKVTVLGSLVLSISIATYAQSISPEEAKTLLNTLPNTRDDTVQINTFLKLAKYHVFKPGENKDDLDSASNFIKKAENVNARIKSNWANGYILLIKSYLLRESGERAEAREAAGSAVTILKNEADKNLSGEAHMELAGYYDYNDADALTQRIELVGSAVNCFAQAGNIQQKAAALQMLGDLNNIKGSSYVALKHLQAALDAYNSIEYKQVQGIYCLMGFIYTRLREYRRALDKELLALKTAESAGDSSMQLCQIYNYLGEIQNALAQKEKAVYYYDKALNVAKKHRDIFAIYLASVNIANVWAALNKPGKALELMKSISSQYEKPNDKNLDYNIARCYIGSYCLLRQFEKARPYANQLLYMINNLKMSDNANISNYTVAIRFFISAGEDHEARKYLGKHRELAKKLKDFYYLAANEKLQFMLDTSLHDFEAATAHLVAFNRLNDSLSVEIKSRQIEELQVQFETEKKEKDILVKDQNIQLLTKQSQLQQSTIKNDLFIRNAMIMGAGLLLLVLILVYSRYVLKQKSNRQLQQQQQQINQQNLSLQTMVKEQNKLIDEKEWLIKEIHHRVKNNLQIVMSLLNSQSAYIDNEPALTAIHDSQHRVHAMSLIHQKLYGSENLSSIDMSVYIRELVSYLADSFNTGQGIRFEYHIEPLELDVSQAVPLGLILNEAITNSIKYAFPDGRTGVISISLSTAAPYHYLLSISDNGIGMPSHFQNKKSGSLGMSLMAGLSEDLNGSFSFENDNGTAIKVSFVLDRRVKEPTTLTPSFVSSN
jgi:two-component sensor histidine kinase/tetratricopeptide (TPR) repeat protein